MAFVSLFSSPPSPALDKNMTDCELTGEEREDGELEDGEIDDEGISIEEVKETKEDTEEVEKEKDKDEKPHRHSRKRHRKIKEKRRAKKSRRERKRHHSAFSGSSEDSHESDYERQDRTTSKKSKISYRDQDGEFALRENDSGKPQRSLQHKNSDVEKHSDYSEEKYDYDDQDDFSEELSKYKQAKESLIHGKSGTPKEQGNRAKDQKFQQKFIGQRGRGRGAMGRGRGALNNMKKQKGKNWGRGRGRGGDQGGGDGDSKGPPSFQKKRPIMSQEFINQHTVEHKGRNICKYFIEGRCIKGDQCKFEHDNVVPAKKKELCKFYVQGFCTKGDICIYMHSEYPCKFFHTGAKCYQGDNCKFSHEPLTDATKELLEKVLNIEEDNGKENDLEMADLRKQGIAPIPKPPPGVGLLPTPGPGSPPDGSKKIPSLFEIKVQPTVGLAQKISLRPTFYNSTSPTTAQFQGAPQFPGNPEGLQAGGMMSPPPSSSISPHSGPLGSPPLPFTGPGIPQSPPAQPSPHGFPIPPPCPPPGFHSSLHQMIPPPLNQQGASFPPLPDGQMNAPFQKVNQMSSDFFRNLFSSQTLSHADEGPAQEPQTHGNTDSSGMQDLLPALLLHLNQNRQDSDSQREEQQGSASSSKDKDDTPNWYSSDEEEGSGVKAILNTLKKQNEMLKNQPSPATADPRLQKERALPSDPRTKPDPRQRPPDLRKEDGNGDPRTVHRIKPLDVSKHDHHPNPTVSRKPALGEDDDESERELRERTAFIPLDPNPGIKLRDPRCQIKQFSHIRVDILLQRPTFAQSVVWGPEDLIPSLIPKQEHSINLPLPPLIADAQLNRSLSSPPDHPPSATLSPPNPRLAAASFKEGIGRIGSPPGRLVDARHQDKPVDPRSLKTLDPRINRSASLDSKPPKIKETRNEKLDPRLKRASTNQSVKSESEKLPPYAPRLALSSGPSLENPTTLLGGISLYDPRNHSLLSPKHDNEEQPTKGILKSPPNPPPHDSQPQESALDTDEKSLADDSENNKDGCPSVPLLPTGISPCSQIGQAAPAVHNLPIQALAGIIRPAYNDPRQNKPVSTTGAIQPEDEEDKDSKKDRPLRDVFKTFDPTASPFFQ